ncbi:MAG: LuxR C-terminal-related transcriptional regulator [Actinomycetota bacterium]
MSLGLIARSDGDEAAEDHFLEALSLFRLGRHRRDAASVLANLGNLAQDRGDLLRASRFLDGAIQLYREIGDRRGAGLVLVNMSIVAERRRDHRRSVELADEAIDEFRATRDDAGLGAAQHNLGNLLLGDGQVVEGLRALDDATESFRRAGDARGVIMTLESLGRAADSVGARSMAWRCRIDRAIILTRLGLERARRSALDQLVLVAEKAGCEPEAAAIGRLADADGTEVERVLQAMRVLGPGDEVDEADTGAASTPVPSRELLDLTARERELLQFVGAGLDNGEIADRMYISKRTVDSHLSHIRTKLGVTDRAKLVVLAREQLA